MESNGRQQGRSTEPAMAQEGTQSGGIEGGGESTDTSKPTGDVPEKVKPKCDRIFVKRGRMYSGDKVIEYLNKLRKKCENERLRAIGLKKTNQKMRARNLKKNEKYIKDYSIMRLKYHFLSKRYKKMMEQWKEKVKAEKEKYKKFRTEDLKLMRKQEWNRAKYYWEVPNDKTNPRNYDIITWTRIYAKLGIVRKRTKLRSYELIVLLWISANEEGTAVARLWSEDTGITFASLKTCAAKLEKYNLVRVYKSGSRNVYELTERGKKFVDPIIAFVKKEHQNAKKRKRKFVRDRVPTP